MAFRIQDSVDHGEIDNRIKGIVAGRIWLHGRQEPLVLKLKGNAWPDLAGCLLQFKNTKPAPSPRNFDGLRTEQEGTIGDLTASRKVRVFDIPFEQARAMLQRKEKPPEHMANSLYLEWFSDANGRVVVEGADYELNISPPEWRLTPEEEEQRRQQASAGMGDFMSRLTQAIERHKIGRKDIEEGWDEFDYERFLRESDARTEKYGELLDKYGHSEEAQEKIDKEMGWTRELTEEEAEEQRQWIEEMNAAAQDALDQPEPEPDPAREGIDWIRTASGDLAHPLQHRALEGAVKLHSALQTLGLLEDDGPVADLLFEFQMTGVKLAGALDSIASGVCQPEPAFTVAYLKRALDHLHKCQAALEQVAGRSALPEQLIAENRKELFEIRESLLKLMEEYRGNR